MVEKQSEIGRDAQLAIYSTNGMLRLKRLLIRLSWVLFRSRNGRRRISGSDGSGIGQGRGTGREDVLTAADQKIE